mmetsp:Transcript_5112/g.7909  ORF Transcript_5112/g.7909 Transcript_5112/m.7909 type:complete len:175 (-) Transcript_5112:62-586(-)
MVRTCDNCRKETGKHVCSSCKKAVYCSKECQRIHWRLHKPNCKSTSEDTNATSSQGSEGPESKPLHHPSCRFTIQQGSIRIAYGFDHISEYFLAVTDSRLKWDESASAEVNSVCEAVFESGEGSLFNIHTGFGGFGRRVSRETMGEFWKRYSVRPEHVEDVLNGNALRFRETPT